MSFGTNKPTAARTTSLSAALNQKPADAPNETAEAEERPKAKLWLNVGITVDFTNEEGEADQEFITLPFGLALDQMKHARVTNSDSLTSKRNAAKNRLLDGLVKYGLEHINPGEDEALPQLTIRLRHASDEVSGSMMQNEFTDAVDRLFSGE